MDKLGRVPKKAAATNFCQPPLSPLSRKLGLRHSTVYVSERVGSSISLRMRCITCGYG